VRKVGDLDAGRGGLVCGCVETSGKMSVREIQTKGQIGLRGGRAPGRFSFWGKGEEVEEEPLKSRTRRSQD